MVVDPRPMPTPVARPHLIGFVVLSLLLHVVLLWWFKPSSGTPERARAESSHKPIQARLVFAPARVEQMAEPEDVLQQPEPKPEPSPPPQKTIALPDTARPAPEPKPEPAPETLPAVVETNSEPQSTTSEAQPAPTTDIRSAADMARQHLQQFQLSKQNDLAEQAARDHRRQLTSPVIPRPTPEPYMTEDEKFLDSVKIKANCDKTGAGATAMIAGLLGGTIECNRPSDFQPFIKRRLNKGIEPQDK